MSAAAASRCAGCGGVHVPNVSAITELLEAPRPPVICMCDLCCGATVQMAADLLDKLAIEIAEAVRARIAGQSQALRGGGVILRTTKIPRPERAELAASAPSN